jgi:uncharacterized protein (TIGR03435 family)
MNGRIVASLLVASIALAQYQPKFEVASIRPSTAKGKGDMDFPPGGERLRGTNVPLSLLIVTAYNVTFPQLSWQSSAFPVLNQKFDVQAKSDHPVNRAEMLGLLQSLLADRFKLVLRRETKPLDAYLLVVDKGGPKLHLSDMPHDNHSAPVNPYRARGAEPSGGYLVFKDESMAEFAWRLSSLVVLGDRVIVDQNGLDGYYDFELKFGPDSTAAPSPPADLPSIFTALHEQLGLRLDARKVPLDVLFVKHAERPAEN